MQNLTLHSHLCILKLPNSLLKVSQRRIDFQRRINFQRRIDFLCSWGEKCWWKTPFWFALCKDVLSSTCLQVGFFWQREQHTKEFVTMHTGCSAAHSSSRKTHTKDAKGKCLHGMGLLRQCVHWETAGAGGRSHRTASTPAAFGAPRDEIPGSPFRSARPLLSPAAGSRGRCWHAFR